MKPTRIDYLNLASTLRKTDDKVEIRYVAQRLFDIRGKRHWSFEQLRDWVMHKDKTLVEELISEISFDDFKKTYKRFEIAKYTSSNGKVKWGVWDNHTSDWSRWLFHGTFRTKKEAEWQLAHTYAPSDEEMLGI